MPHTRPAPVTGSATDQELVERLGLSASRYEGPTGIVGVLHDVCRQARHPVGEPLGGRSALRLADAEPARRARALRAARRLLGVEIDADELEEAARNYAEQVSEAVASDAETAAYVEELERRADELDDATELPRATRSPPS